MRPSLSLCSASRSFSVAGNTIFVAKLRRHHGPARIAALSPCLMGHDTGVVVTCAKMGYPARASLGSEQRESNPQTSSTPQNPTIWILAKLSSSTPSKMPSMCLASTTRKRRSKLQQCTKPISNRSGVSFAPASRFKAMMPILPTRATPPLIMKLPRCCRGSAKTVELFLWCNL